jgi:DNA-binding NarL/FixJ family response regulator
MEIRPRVVIAENHTMVAEGLTKLLEGEFELLDPVGNGRDLLKAVEDSRPDLVLLDIAMPILNGIEATRHFHKACPSTKVIVVTAHNEPEYVMEAFRAGASGYVLKRCAVSELVIAIRRVLEGHTYVTPLVAEHVVTAATNPKLHRNPANLTTRQREVLELVAEGCTAKEIATSLQLSVKTAVFHKMAIMDKLGLRTTAELTRYALEHGITRRGAQWLRFPLDADLESSEKVQVAVALHGDR